MLHYSIFFYHTIAFFIFWCMLIDLICRIGFNTFTKSHLTSSQDTAEVIWLLPVRKNRTSDSSNFLLNILKSNKYPFSNPLPSSSEQTFACPFAAFPNSIFLNSIRAFSSSSKMWALFLLPLVYQVAVPLS